MNLFEQIAKQKPKCEICGSETIALYGGGFENDVIYCSDDNCGAEYNFPTSTLAED